MKKLWQLPKLTIQSLGIHPSAPPSKKMMDDVGLDFDDLGVKLKPNPRKSRIWLAVALAAWVASMLIIKPLFGLGIAIGILAGSIVCFIWLLRMKAP